ncbi:SdpI family protein [Cellulomonas hominis]|uniref:SdpI family protein n=1 Tax=Cellulomonas hominis TaxID=156981 RepID=A0A7Z8NQW4_9CELL|nr:SdpI family protein [Cellulomonas hominis]TKR26700.1 SdpI family protein [Cellulomonas hominis]
MRLFLAVAGLAGPALMVAAHPLFRLAARQGPNAWVGYRTPRSRRTEEGWRFAQEECAWVWRRAGAWYGAAGLAAFGALAAGGAGLPVWEAASVVLALGPLLGTSAWCVVRIERALAAGVPTGAARGPS